MNAFRHARDAYQNGARSAPYYQISINVPRERALVGLALRAFALEHGHRPMHLSEIVPAYLPEPPVSDSLRAKLGAE